MKIQGVWDSGKLVETNGSDEQIVMASNDDKIVTQPMYPLFRLVGFPSFFRM